MLFPQEKRGDPGAPGASPGQGSNQAPAPQQIIVQTPGTGVKIPILFGAVIALLGACGYLFYQVNQVRADLTQTRDSLAAEIAKINETSSVTTQTSRHNLEQLKTEVERARAQAAQLSGQAKNDASAHADQLASQAPEDAGRARQADRRRVE